MDIFGNSLYMSPTKSPKSPRAMRPHFNYQTPPPSGFSPPRSVDTPPPSSSKSSRRLQQVLDMKICHPFHVRQNSSVSSLSSDPQSPVQGIAALSPSAISSSDDNSNSSRKKNGQKGKTSSKLPRGLSIEEACKSLPSSVKNALTSHAQSESMGYFVLLPQEVVQLNEVYTGTNLILTCRSI
jgi:hypothetical protein